MTEAPEIVQPQPCPTTWGTGQVRTPDGKTNVIVSIQTVVGGPFLFFLEPEFAEQIGNMLLAAGRTARTGLIVGGNGGLHIPPNGHPG